MYTIVCAVSAKNHPQILRSQVEQSRATDFCCDKETGAANTWAVLARLMAQSRRKSVPPDLLRVILLWHSDAACRPAGLRLRKRCRHFAVPSPLGLLTPPAGCTTLPPFLRRELSFPRQESYRTLTRLPHKKFCVFFAGTPGNIACELYIAAAKSGVRKRCRHFAVPSPLGLLAPPAARRECCARSFSGWGKNPARKGVIKLPAGY